MGDQSTDRLLVLAPTPRMQAGSSVSKTTARLALAANENCFVLSVGNQDTLPENAFQINFLPERTREIIGIPNHKKRESQAALTPKLLVETPIVKKLVTDGSNDSNFHRKLPARAVSNFVTVPVTLDHGTPTVAVKIQGAERILIVDSGSNCSLLQPGVAEVPLESRTFEPFGVTGDSLDIVGEQQVLFEMGRVTYNHSFLVCKLPTSADGIIGLNFLTPRQARLDLGSFSLRICLNTNLDFAASSRHEALLEECKRRERRGLITHVSISHNPSRDRSDESGCIKSTRKDNLKHFDEETTPKIKETNPRPHEIKLNVNLIYKSNQRQTYL